MVMTLSHYWSGPYWI